MQQTASFLLALPLTFACASGPEPQAPEAARAPVGNSFAELFQTTFGGGGRMKRVEVSAAPAPEGARRLNLDPSTTFQTL